jgi:hypothetical protein
MPPTNSPFFGLLEFRLVSSVWRNGQRRSKAALSVLIVVVSEFGRMAFGILVSEKCSGTCAETVATGFRPEKHIALHKSPLSFGHT